MADAPEITSTRHQNEAFKVIPLFYSAQLYCAQWQNKNYKFIFT